MSDTKSAAGLPSHLVGLVDGSEPATTRRFYTVLADDAVAQLDELVATTQALPDGTELTHYGIVVEGTGQIEGAEMPSDTARISRDHTMPGITTRRVEVQILRTVPEMWIPPAPGAPVARATGPDRDAALFLDQMEQPLAVGLDQNDEPIYVDFSFLNGEKGGHISISGISGVATKTTYALFLLYVLFETDQGLRLLGTRAPQTRALVFAVKGEDLLHLDRAEREVPRPRRSAPAVATPGRGIARPFPQRRALRPSRRWPSRRGEDHRCHVPRLHRGVDVRLATDRVHPTRSAPLLLRRRRGRFDPGVLH